MSNVLYGLAQFMLYAVMAAAAQNAVLGRSLGVTRLVQLVEDTGLDTVVFCMLLTLIQVLSAPLCFFTNRALAPLEFRAALRPLAFFVCTFLVLSLVQAACRLLKNSRAQKVKELLPLATFNTCVLGTLMICAMQGFSLLQYVGFGFGSGIGYMLSVLLITEGQRKLNRRNVPSSFRGLPLMLIYIGILSMVIYGMTGHRLAF